MPAEANTQDPPEAKPAEGQQQTPEQIAEELKRISAKYDLEKKHRKTAETKLSELEKWRQEQEAAQAERDEETARKQAEKGDTKALEDSWKGKLTKTEEKYKGELSKRDQMIADLTVKADASRLASQVFGEQADVMLHHVEKRLKVEYTEDGPKTRVLDESGQPSALNLDELANELKSAPRFAPFVVATKATGSGAQGGKGGGGAPQKTMPSADFYKLPEPERKAFIKSGGKLK